MERKKSLKKLTAKDAKDAKEGQRQGRIQRATPESLIRQARYPHVEVCLSPVLLGVLGGERST
jgi:hypothetical protein